jgi:hypothetical protein
VPGSNGLLVASATAHSRPPEPLKRTFVMAFDAPVTDAGKSKVHQINRGLATSAFSSPKMRLKMGVSKKMCGTIYCNHRVRRRGALKAAAGFAVAAGVDRASAMEGGAEQPKRNAIGADAALRRLMEGNARYVANKGTPGVFRRTRREDQGAISDYCGPELRGFARCPEFAFDQGPGDLFVVRLAGNFAKDDGHVKRLETAQPLLASFAQSKEVKIVGGVYDLANGKIGLLS